MNLPLKIAAVIVLFFGLAAKTASANEPAFRSTHDVQGGTMDLSVFVSDDHLTTIRAYNRPCRDFPTIHYVKTVIALSTIGEVTSFSSRGKMAVYIEPKKRFTLFGIKGELEHTFEAYSCRGDTVTMPDVPAVLIFVEEERSQELLDIILSAVSEN